MEKKEKFKKEYYFIAAAVAVAAAGLYFAISYRPEAGLPPLPVHTDWKHYENKRLGFGLEYPNSWALEVQGADTVIFSNPEGAGEVTVSVTSPEKADIIRRSLSIAEEKEVQIGGIKGSRILEESGAGKGAMRIILATANGKLYYIAGDAAQFDQMIKTFRFLENN